MRETYHICLGKRKGNDPVIVFRGCPPAAFVVTLGEHSTVSMSTGGFSPYSFVIKIGFNNS